MPDFARAMGFDFGTKKIGVAFGQSLLGTAQPLTPVPARDGIPDWDLLEKLVKEWQPQVLVVGLPLNMDGSESELSQRARKFGNRLNARFRLPVQMMDERLTTREARDTLSAVHERRKGKLPSLDSTAAVLMLESFLAT